MVYIGLSQELEDACESHVVNDSRSCDLLKRQPRKLLWMTWSTELTRSAGQEVKPTLVGLGRSKVMGSIERKLKGN